MSRKSEAALEAQISALQLAMAELRSEINRLKVEALPKVIPDGRYEAGIVEVVKRQSKTERYYWRVEFELTHVYEGKKLWGSYPNGWRFLQLCETLGVPVAEQSLEHYLGGHQGIQYSLNEQNLVGKLCNIRVGHGQYDKMTYNTVDEVYKPNA